MLRGYLPLRVLTISVALAAVGCPPEEQCTTDDDCRRGAVCNDKACVPGCRSAGNCLNGQACVAEVCVAGCLHQFQCRDGEICDARTRECTACVAGAAQCPCTSAGGCDDGLTCCGTYCSVACPPPRCGDSRCEPGEDCPIDCDGATVCGDGLCERGEVDCPTECELPVYDAEKFDESPVTRRWNACPPRAFVPRACPVAPALAAVATSLSTLWAEQPNGLCAYSAVAPYCASSPLNAFYCPSTDLIIYDPVLLAQAQARAGISGSQSANAAVLAILAHEWGHAIQARTGQLSQPRYVIESQADCLSAHYLTFHFAARGETPTSQILDGALAMLEVMEENTGGNPYCPEGGCCESWDTYPCLARRRAFYEQGVVGAARSLTNYEAAVAAGRTTVTVCDWFAMSALTACPASAFTPGP